MQKHLKEYVRETKNSHPIGIVVAKKIDSDNVRIGFSLCNPKDKFDKVLGENIALNRAESDGFNLPESPKYQTLLNERFESLRRRAANYFKVPSENVY
jgi:hypothetical protein